MRRSLYQSQDALGQSDRTISAISYFFYNRSAAMEYMEPSALAWLAEGFRRKIVGLSFFEVLLAIDISAHDFSGGRTSSAGSRPS